MNAPITELPILAALLRAAKEDEDKAKQVRLGIEEQILAHFPNDKPEGSITDKNLGLTVTYKLTRKVIDSDALGGEWMQLSRNAQSAFKWKAEIDTKQYKALQDMDEASFMAIAKHIETKPAKPSVTLKETNV